MKVAILGYDVEGRASYDYFAALGYELEIHDQDPSVSIPDGVLSVLGNNYLDDLGKFDLLVRTASLPPHKILEKNPDVGPKITSQINEFLKVAPTKNIIGVTGSKGKGTTSTLIAEMLQAAHLEVELGGNIGRPPLTFLNKLSEQSWVVLELSSFQLIDLQRSPHIGVCLMVIPEHQDWHSSLDEYYTAKAQLFSHQSRSDIAIYFVENESSKKIAGAGEGRKMPYFAAPGAVVNNNAIKIDDQLICGLEELKLLGKHNLQNICAAVTAVWQVKRDIEAMRSVLTSFTGLEHRLQLIRDIHGVRYYDDSFGTAPQTAIVALETFSQPKVVILGGSTKGADFTELAKSVTTNNVRHVVIMGNTANPEHTTDSPKIEAALRGQGFSNITSLIMPGGPQIEEVVRAAQTVAEPGDVVLLSTACTSFDMFHDYKDRGERFSAAVQALV